MASEKYTPPALNESAFHCAICGVYASQTWYDAYANSSTMGSFPLRYIRVARCAHCGDFSIWRGAAMLFPASGTAPLPNPDLPPDIRADYEEAREIASKSPRGAAALLRLCIQKLCKHLELPGKNIDDDIATLVANGLPKAVQKALDTVRVTGNESVHPGTLDLRDDPALAGALFNLVNFIAEKMISEPREIDALYEKIPQAKRDAIEKRDGKSTKP